MPAIPPNRAERDDELRRLVLELDALEKKRSALQERLKLLLGLGQSRRRSAASRFSQAELDRLANAR